MSRLDTFIARLVAQRACIGRARELIHSVQGPVLELGLGNGRTFDHLRHVFPQRDIFVFERQPAPHPDCMPAAERLIVGELRETLAAAMDRVGAPAAFVHSDIGTADAARNARLAGWLAGVLPGITAPGGVVASDQELDAPALETLPLPAGVEAGRYWFYRRRGASR